MQSQSKMQSNVEIQDPSTSNKSLRISSSSTDLKIREKLTLTGYTTISALMEQKTRLYDARNDAAKKQQAERFPIKLIPCDENIDSTESEAKIHLDRLSRRHAA